MELEVGTIFLRNYLVERLVGQGCMGRVYEAHDNALDRRVAIRLIDPEYDNPRVAGFSENDATVVGRVSSVHLAELVSVGILPSGERCIITEFVEGETLQRRMARLGRMSQLGVTQLLSQLLAGLGAALQAGGAHRDFTPRSIFISPAKTGSGHVARIIDFGISRLQVLRNDPNSALATDEAYRNSFQYLSPEQLNGLREPDARSNIYTLGVIAYEAMTGRLPFEGKDFVTLASNILLEEPKPIEELVPEASAPLVELIRLAMARSPNSRFQSAEEMSAAVAGFADETAGLYSGLESKPPPGLHREVPVSVSTEQANPGPALAAAYTAPLVPAAPETPEPPPPPPPVEEPVYVAPLAPVAPEYPEPPPPPPPPPPVEEPVYVAPLAPAAPRYPAPPPMGDVPLVASAPKYPAPPPMGDVPLVASAPKYPAPPPMDVADPGRPSSETRPWQATSPGLQPEAGASPMAAQVAPPVDEPIAPPPPVDEPIAPPPPVDEPAAPRRAARAFEPITAPPAVGGRALRSKRPASSQPPVAAEPVSNVRHRLEPTQAESPDEVGTYGRPATRSRKPLVLLILLLGLAAAGIAFALIPGGSEKPKEGAKEVVPSADVVATERVAPSAARSAPELATAEPVVSAVPTPKQSPAAAALPAAPPKTQTAARTVQTAKKSTTGTPATPAKKQGTAKRASTAKDPYNYR